MDKRIISFSYEDEANLKGAFKIREVVFINEQNCSIEEEFDGLDEE